MSYSYRIVLIYLSFSVLLTLVITQILERVYFVDYSNQSRLQIYTIAFLIILISAVFLFYLLRVYAKTDIGTLSNDVTNSKIRTDAQFNEFETRFNALADKGDDMIAMIDSNSKMFYSSPNMIRILGYSMSEFYLNNGLEYMHPDDLNSSEALFQKVLSNPGVSFPYQYRIVHKTHKYCWVEGTIINLLNDSDVGAIISVFRDISEKKKINDRLIQKDEALYLSNEKYKLVSKATKDTIWDFDMNTQEIEWNLGLAVNFGYFDSPKNYNRDWWVSSIHPEDKKRVLIKLEKSISLKQSNWEDEYRFKDVKGNYRSVFDRAIISYDAQNNPKRMIGVMQDVTFLKQTELSLLELNKELEDRATELAVSNEELERFAYVASHDLQEPLRMVSSFLFLLQKKYENNLDETAHQYIHFAVDASERMKKLISDLLEYSKASNAQKLLVEEVNLNEVVELIRTTFENHKSGNKFELICEELPTILANKTQIIQLFQNLISNAIKYSKVNVMRQIKISSTSTASEWQFEINDNGIGIQVQHLEQIFVIFHRLHGKSQYSGTGIGLATCKKIVEKHKGKIWAESVYGVGSTFKFSISKKITETSVH